MKKELSLAGLGEVIGTISKENKTKLKKVSKEITLPNIKKQPKNPVENSMGIQPSEVKVQESFKISPSLKKMVEDIVKQMRKKGNKITKGKVYNHLIAKGLESL